MTALTLIVDNLSGRSVVTDYLRDKGITIVESYLRGGQYRITDTCDVWHVTVGEFNRLVRNKAIFRRILELKRGAPEPIIIVEGHPISDPSQLSPGAIRGALAFITMHNRVPLLTVGNAQEVAELVFMMVNQAQKGMGLPPGRESADGEEPRPAQSTMPPVSGGNGLVPEDPVARRQYILQALPDVTPVIAQAMLKEFGSLRAVFSASAKELTSLSGIGPKKAWKIAGFISGDDQ